MGSGRSPAGPEGLLGGATPVRDRKPFCKGEAPQRWLEPELLLGGKREAGSCSGNQPLLPPRCQKGASGPVALGWFPLDSFPSQASADCLMTGESEQPLPRHSLAPGCRHPS